MALPIIEVDEDFDENMPRWQRRHAMKILNLWTLRAPYSAIVVVTDQLGKPPLDGARLVFNKRGGGGGMVDLIRTGEGTGMTPEQITVGNAVSREGEGVAHVAKKKNGLDATGAPPADRVLAVTRGDAGEGVADLSGQDNGGGQQDD